MDGKSFGQRSKTYGSFKTVDNKILDCRKTEKPGYLKIIDGKTTPVSQ